MLFIDERLGSSGGNLFLNFSLKKGFTLAELIITVLLVGIFAGMGISHFSSVTQEIRTETIYQTLDAFFSACRSRAVFRQIPVKLQVTPRGIQIENSPTFYCLLPKLTEDSKRKVENLCFTATQTLLFGQKIDRITLEFYLSDNQNILLNLQLGK